jgi:hypothetical protein
MNKEQRFMTLTLLKLAKTFCENTDIYSADWQSKLFEDFVTSICSINGIHYDDPISYRIYMIVITFACVEFQLRPYPISRCLAEIEKELASLGRAPSWRKKKVALDE